MHPLSNKHEKVPGLITVSLTLRPEHCTAILPCARDHHFVLLTVFCQFYFITSLPGELKGGVGDPPRLPSTTCQLLSRVCHASVPRTQAQNRAQRQALRFPNRSISQENESFERDHVTDKIL